MKNYIIEEMDFVCRKEEVLSYIVNSNLDKGNGVSIIDVTMFPHYFESNNVDEFNGSNVQVYSLSGCTEKQVSKKIAKLRKKMVLGEEEKTDNLFVCSPFQIDFVFEELRRNLFILPIEDTDAIIRHSLRSIRWKGFLVKSYQRFILLRFMHQIFNKIRSTKLYMSILFNYIFRR
ncbi:hypothetical protein FYJ84_08635 [Veillonellaceae bacterium WCA-693-APC-5D-A]|uniref:Uncharacterized protein n=1 Tax=Anaerovibrio slackiae TaxID=2652309 RepID=A0A6I2UH63_9FIRM|nr:hypothetical protein [Anaerovibrio slackiae]MSU09049.1 hypothetical protein [Anaerovibrio slackiae]